MRYATPAELGSWDRLIAANPDGGHILQSHSWGEFKRKHNWQPLYLIAQLRGEEVAVMALRRHFPAFGEMWYTPKGPGVASHAQLSQLALELPPGRRPFLIRTEPELPDQDGLPPGVQYRRAPIDIQINRSTVVVPLGLTEEALLSSFKPKTRYNIRLAQKKGIRVLPVGASTENLHIMYRLMKATRSRNSFVLWEESYFSDYWRMQSQSGNGQLFFAVKDSEVLAGAFVTFLGSKAWYKDGGSVTRHKELMAPYALQWEIMRWLQAHEIQSYDLVAVPPAHLLSEEHPLYGLWRFKSGFCADITQYIGTLDFPLSMTAYRGWTTLGERTYSRLSMHRSKEPVY